MTADQVRSLQPALTVLVTMFRPCFKRAASAEHWERCIVGLITELKRTSIEPIALAAGVAARTLQELHTDMRSAGRRKELRFAYRPDPARLNRQLSS